MKKHALSLLLACLPAFAMNQNQLKMLPLKPENFIATETPVPEEWYQYLTHDAIILLDEDMDEKPTEYPGAITLGLAEAIQQKTVPIIVSGSLLYNVLIQQTSIDAELQNSSITEKIFETLDKRVNISHKIRECLKKSLQFPTSFEKQIQLRQAISDLILNQLSNQAIRSYNPSFNQSFFNQSLKALLDGHYMYAPFNFEEWDIYTYSGTRLYLLIPKIYLKQAAEDWQQFKKAMHETDESILSQINEQTGNTQDKITIEELKLGFMIDHQEILTKVENQIDFWKALEKPFTIIQQLLQLLELAEKSGIMSSLKNNPEFASINFKDLPFNSRVNCEKLSALLDEKQELLMLNQQEISSKLAEYEDVTKKILAELTNSTTNIVTLLKNIFIHQFFISKKLLNKNNFISKLVGKFNIYMMGHGTYTSMEHIQSSTADPEARIANLTPSDFNEFMSFMHQSAFLFYWFTCFGGGYNLSTVQRHLNELENKKNTQCPYSQSTTQEPGMIAVSGAISDATVMANGIENFSHFFKNIQLLYRGLQDATTRGIDIFHKDHRKELELFINMILVDIGGLNPSDRCFLSSIPWVRLPGEQFKIISPFIFSLSQNENINYTKTQLAKIMHIQSEHITTPLNLHLISQVVLEKPCHTFESISMFEEYELPTWLKPNSLYPEHNSFDDFLEKCIFNLYFPYEKKVIIKSLAVRNNTPIAAFGPKFENVQEVVVKYSSRSGKTPSDPITRDGTITITTKNNEYYESIWDENKGKVNVKTWRKIS